MWRFKGCPRCGGDIFVDYDHYGWYERCLQCGYNLDRGSNFRINYVSVTKFGRNTLANIKI